MYRCVCFYFRVTDDGLQTRAHLETQLAASLALKSPQEYRQCLLSYIRFLARFVHYIFISFICFVSLSCVSSIDLEYSILLLTLC
jgi:hypothetical protein